MHRLRARKDEDGEWEDRLDWNTNERDDAHFPSDKEILAESKRLEDYPRQWHTLTNFAATTSFHGLYYLLGRGHHPMKRILWGIALIFTAVMFSIQCFYLVRFYYQYEHSYEVRIKSPKKMPFPAVSICNLNGLKASVMNGSELDQLLRKKFSWLASLGYNNNSKSPLAEIAKHNLKDMLKYCRFYRNRCSPKNFTTFTYLMSQNCFTFNSGEEGHPLVTQTNTGRYRGLGLRLDVEHHEYYFGARAAGIRMFVHEQGNIPTLTSGIVLSPGTSNHVIVSKKEYKRLSKPYKTGCGEEKLKYYKKYSPQNCFRESLTKYISTKCGCKMDFMPGKTRLCSKKEIFRCVFRHWRKFNNDEIFYDECPVPCEYTRYSVSHSHAFFPTKLAAERIAKKMNLTGTKEENLRYLRENILEVYVFFDDFHYEKYHEEPAFELHILIAAICGMLVWFFGISLLTFYELIDFILTISVREIKRRFRSNNYQTRM